MEAEFLILSALARKKRNEISQAVIKNLTELTGDKFLLSGNDSPLKNVWEEYCIDVQEGSFFSSVYEDTVLNYVTAEIEKLCYEEQLMLYVNTEAYFEVLDDLEKDGNFDKIKDIPLDVSMVTKDISELICEKASNFSNYRIEQYLSGGSDDEIDDDEEFYDEDDDDEINDEREKDLSKDDNGSINNDDEYPHYD